MAAPDSFDARAFLEGIVGQTITTITGRPNTVISIQGDDVYVRTGRSAATSGAPVPIQWVQDAADTLYANGEIGINTMDATHRSAFIGAVLATLPGASGLRDPTRVVLDAPGARADAVPSLQIGHVYHWNELAEIFGFKPQFFSVAGGMVPSAATGALLLITHPGGARSFDYQDYWDGTDLIYTGRGKVGDQSRDEARNLDVAENRRPLLVFEAAGSRRLMYRGRAVKVQERTGRAPDDTGAMRNVLLFRLRFDGAVDSPSPPPELDDAASRSRVARPFREEPPAPISAPQGEAPDPEITAAKREQASQGHHALVGALHRLLNAVQCTDVAEIPGAIDLWAIRAEGTRMIFEAKTISAVNELSQTRGGFAQLHEYRAEYGTPADELCLVVDRALAVKRQKMLDSLGVAVLVLTNGDLQAGNDRGSVLVDALTQPSPPGGR